MRHLILGGARSGKSRFAEQCAIQTALPVCYVATATAGDREMAERIARHQAERPSGWRTIEEPRELAAVLLHEAVPNSCLLVDCLTLWLANLFEAGTDIPAARDELAHLLPQLPGEVLLVSNEVGLGIVPDNALARLFRDEAGRLNQALAAACDRVTFVAAGLPLTLKDTSVAAPLSPDP